MTSNKATDKKLSYVTYYKFVNLSDLPGLQKELKAKADALSLLGTILISQEGINSTMTGTKENLEIFIDYLHSKEEFSDLTTKWSEAAVLGFRRMLVKIKKEVIGMGFPHLDPKITTGKYIKPLELQKILATDPDSVIMVDTRNDYEVRIGTFEGALDPSIKNFKEFPQWVRDNLSTDKKKKIVTFCTGGIRCEKATAWMVEEGFEDVYQIDGGILQYFEDCKEHGLNPHYDGACFVFDYRVGVDPQLKKTKHELCYACGQPLNEAEREDPLYIPGVQCSYCHDYQKEKLKKREDTIEEKRKLFMERKKDYKVEKQLEIAKRRETLVSAEVEGQ